VPQDPAVIARQIEQTRAELAETVDAIATMVSPKRVAERASAQVKDKVAELRQRVGPDRARLSGPGGEPGAERASGAAGANGRSGHRELVAGEQDGSAVVVRRSVRWDRVGVAAGTTMLLVGMGRRRRHRRRDS
jgi:Protein of unknown function (DUF3618)